MDRHNCERAHNSTNVRCDRRVMESAPCRADASATNPTIVAGHTLFDHIRPGAAGSVPVELQAFDVD